MKLPLNGVRLALVNVFLLAFGVWGATAASASNDWVDADTGHRVVQLSNEPGSESLYFNLNPFTPDGHKMVITAPTGISLINLQTHEVEKIVEGRARIIMVGRKTGQIYYGTTKIEDGVTNRWVNAIDPRTKVIRPLLKLARGQEVSTVNSDETLLAGTWVERPDGGTNRDYFDGGTNRVGDIQSANFQRGKKGAMMEDRLAKRYPMSLFFYNLATGKTTKCSRGTDWLGHLQFSPTDPGLLLYCHEGPWHKVDRIWTIRANGKHRQLVHQRTMVMEIAGHEFWSADGKTIWYDLQTPRGEVFWVAGYDVADSARTWYHLARDEWGVHFNVAPDGKLFSSDGGDGKMVAHASDGKWLYLLRPELIADRADGNVDTKRLIQTGVFHAEKLVNMEAHDYALEPNAMFTPDMKWIVFRSNRSGANQVYAVELARAEKK